MNVFRRELAAYRRSMIVWAASLSGLVVVFMALYPAFTTDVELMRDLLGQFPEVVRDAFNISLSSFFTIYGFYGYLLSFAILAGAIQAMNLGTGIISKEVSGKTADFLLSKPITRARVVTAKLAAALVVLIVTNAVFSVVAFATARGVAEEPFDTGTFFLMSSTLALVQLFFLALGALFAVSLPKIKSVVAVSLPTVFAFYIIAMIGDVLADDRVSYLTPFKFYETSYIVDNGGLDGVFLAIEVGFLAVAVALSYWIYLKKDVPSSA